MKDTEAFRILIVDDERPAREKMARLLSEHWPTAQLVQANDGQQALELLAQQRYEVMFLDIQMPELDGLQVAQQLTPPIPDIVFVTAFDQYAVKAFDANAIDYLLKPYDEERFLKALSKLRGRRAEHPTAHVQNDPPLMISERGHVYVVPTSNVVWAEAADNYVIVYTEDKHYMLRQTMSGLHERLGAAFARCHRRYLVRLDAIQACESLSKGDAQLVLRHGAQVPCSRQYREEILQRLGQTT